MAIYRLGDRTPDLHDSAWVADTAAVIGSVVMHERASVWFGAVVRGDNEPIVIGRGSNVQENCTLHTDMGAPMVIGEDVTVGHGVTLHGCTIGDGALIGIGATVLNHAKIGRNCLVGAGAVVTEGKEFPDNSLILGAPAKVVKTLSDEQAARLRAGSANYVRNAARFRDELERLD